MPACYKREGYSAASLVRLRPRTCSGSFVHVAVQSR